MVKYRKWSHTTYDCRYHLVWITKYRNPCLSKKLQERLETVLRWISKQLYVKILSIWMESDHVHMYISIPLSKPIPKVVQMLKWRSSQVLRQEYWEELEYDLLLRDVFLSTWLDGLEKKWKKETWVLWKKGRKIEDIKNKNISLWLDILDFLPKIDNIWQKDVTFRCSKGIEKTTNTTTIFVTAIETENKDSFGDFFYYRWRDWSPLRNLYINSESERWQALVNFSYTDQEHKKEIVQKMENTDIMKIIKKVYQIFYNSDEIKIQEQEYAYDLFYARLKLVENEKEHLKEEVCKVLDEELEFILDWDPHENMSMSQAKKVKYAKRERDRKEVPKNNSKFQEKKKAINKKSVLRIFKNKWVFVVPCFVYFVKREKWMTHINKRIQENNIFAASWDKLITIFDLYPWTWFYSIPRSIKREFHIGQNHNEYWNYYKKDTFRDSNKPYADMSKLLEK